MTLLYPVTEELAADSLSRSRLKNLLSVGDQREAVPLTPATLVTGK